MPGPVLDLLADAAATVDAARDLVPGARVDEVVAVLRSAEELARKAHSLALAAVATAEATGAAAAAGFGSTRRLLEHALRLPAHEARARVAHAAALGSRRGLTGEVLAPELPATAAALAAGTVGAPQIAVIADATARVPSSAGPDAAGRVEAQLAALAQQHAVPALRRLAQRMLDHLDPDGPRPGDDEPLPPTAGSVRWWRRRDGRYGIDGWLEPVPGATLDALLAALARPGPTVDGVPDPRTADQRAADALIEVGDLARAAPARPTTGAEPPHITVTVDLATLTGPRPAPDRLPGLPGIPAPRDGTGPIAVDPFGGPTRGAPRAPCPQCADPLDDDGRCHRRGAVLDHGTHIRAAEARLAACDARVIPAVLGADSVPLDVGRAVRTVTGPLRRAVVARDGGCTFPGCDRAPHSCQVHHVVHWADGGASSLANCTLVCAHHHRFVHATGWRIEVRGRDVRYTPPPAIDPDRRPSRNRLRC